MKEALDKIWFGFLIGIIMPLIFGYIFIITTYSGDVNFVSLFRFMTSMGVMVKMIFVAVLPDMGAAFVLNSIEMWRACRGLFAALGVYILLGAVMLFI